MSLPSFSGKTVLQPDLLKYSCRLNCRVRPVSPARVSTLPLTEGEEEESGADMQTRQQRQVNSDVLSVLTGKPLVALAFANMAMSVDAPAVVAVAEPAASQVSKGKHRGHGLLSRFPKLI